MNNTDKNGKYFETGWDIVNVIMDVTSFVSNVASGNIGASIVDAVGLVVDVAATVVPGVPGGAGPTIKAARFTDKATDAIKTADRVTDAVHTVGKADDATKVAAKSEVLRDKATIGQEAHRQIEKHLEDAFGAQTEVRVDLKKQGHMSGRMLLCQMVRM